MTADIDTLIDDVDAFVETMQTIVDQSEERRFVREQLSSPVGSRVGALRLIAADRSQVDL